MRQRYFKLESKIHTKLFFLRNPLIQKNYIVHYRYRINIGDQDLKSKIYLYLRGHVLIYQVMFPPNFIFT